LYFLYKSSFVTIATATVALLIQRDFEGVTQNIINALAATLILLEQQSRHHHHLCLIATTPSPSLALLIQHRRRFPDCYMPPPLLH
jgi:hypothetical protein